MIDDTWYPYGYTTDVSWKNPNPEEMIIGGNLHFQHPLVEIPRLPPPCNTPTLAAHVL